MPRTKIPPSQSQPLKGARVLVTGGAGRLARHLVPHLATLGAEVWAPPRQALDLLSPDAKKAICAFEPTWIIHGAGLTSVEACERNPDAAEAGNVATTACVVEASRRAGCRGIYISTDYVFGGEGAAPYSEDDVPSPMNVYGWSKYRGEQVALERGWAVARVAWLYGDGEGFEGFVAGSAQGARVPILDQRGTPTDIDQAAISIAELSLRAEGVYHIVGETSLTRLEWARRICDAQGLSLNLVEIPVLEGALATRPRDSSLINTRFDCKKLG